MKLYKTESLLIIKEIEDKAKKYFNIKYDLNFNKSYGIDGTTFRSFRKIEKPSQTYRGWVNELIKNDSTILWKISNVKSKEEFQKLHSELAKNLNSYWLNAYNIEFICISKINKMLDLFLKYFSRTNQAKEKNIDLIILKYGNIPLDKHSLLRLKDLFYGIVISKKPSMGDIDDKDTYYFIQNQIYHFMVDAEMPNLYFDQKND